ncbi:unnamed protein product [Spirodela intermedia]|uniref:Uncharacterized protein n=1 Tax=Spirodela intermedia TaxID=51605 RepID=A0A7I8JT50_SPIIN|nr:unnamed protein product [Spirodela intermedia]CAA6673377.1 unnamed protein product [Spirodela intermedia]
MVGLSPILQLPAPPLDGNLGPVPLSQVVGDGDSDLVEGKLKEQSGGAEQKPGSVTTHTRTIGIIHPPPDIRTIIDKTSSFVSKNGPEFERRILAHNAGNAKFNFLIPTDPYHAYYQHRLSEFRSQLQSSAGQPEAPADDSSKPSESAPAADASLAPSESAVAAKVDIGAQFKIPLRKVLEPPEAEQYTLDIIKLTAQFVARNGKSFLAGLTSREINNPQFHFLKPTHSLFTFFTALADAYSKVLMPPKGLTEKLRGSARDMTIVLERCLHRLEWERSQEQARQKAEDEIEQERVQMAMIDWHDFVVVETIEFADDEDMDLPEPLTLEEVIRNSKATTLEEQQVLEMAEPGKEVEMEMDEEEIQLVQEGMMAARLDESKDEEKLEPRAAPEHEPPMRIVKNWRKPEERHTAERDPTKFVVSPITGELIPISEMAEHMRISLIDPKYKEQKERMMAKIRETTLAQDDEISRNIEEVSNAVKAEIEKKKEEQPKQVIWDGHAGSIGRTANQAMTQTPGEEQTQTSTSDSRMLPGPAPPPKPGMPMVRPLPPPPGLALNIPWNAPMPPVMPVPSSVRPPPPMSMSSQQHLMQPMHLAHQVTMNPPSMPIPPPPGSQFTPLVPRPFVQMTPPPPPMQMVAPPLPQGMPPPPPPEEAPPLPDEPEPKRQRIDEVTLIPEDKFLAQHLGPARVSISVPNVDEGNLKGQVLEITVQSLSETIGSLKEKIAGEVQLPANKQKLSGRAGFLKDNLTLAYYNVGPGETLTLALRNVEVERDDRSILEVFERVINLFQCE